MPKIVTTTDVPSQAIAFHRVFLSSVAVSASQNGSETVARFHPTFVPTTSSLEVAQNGLPKVHGIPDLNRDRGRVRVISYW